MGLPQSRPHALQPELGDAWQFGLHGAVLRGHDVGPGLRRPGDTIGLLCDSGEKAPSLGSRFTSFEVLQFNDSAFQRDCDCVCAIVGIQLGKDALEVVFNGLLRNIEVRCDGLV